MTNETTMPEMPEPHVHAEESDDGFHYYTGAQLRAYAAKAVAMERERAAACVPTNWLDPLLTGPHAVIARGIDAESIVRLLASIRERIRKGAPE